MSRLAANLGFGAIGRSLKDMFVPAYGLFGGPGNPPSNDDGRDLVEDPDAPGVDGIDHKFKGHDHEYRDPLKTPRSIRDADFNLVKGLLGASPRIRLIDIAFGGHPSSGSVYKFFALNFFTGSTVVRTARL
jgi:hypothetical protein